MRINWAVANEREPFPNIGQCRDASASTSTSSAPAQQLTQWLRKDSLGSHLRQQIYWAPRWCSARLQLNQGGHPYRNGLKLKDAHSRKIMLHKCSSKLFFLFSKLNSSDGSLGSFFFLDILVLAFRHVANHLEFKLNWAYKFSPILQSSFAQYKVSCENLCWRQFLAHLLEGLI